MPLCIIIQPGRIGDTIISLPIANFYHKQGYKICWPLMKSCLKHFNGRIDYVGFYPVNNSIYKCLPEARRTSIEVHNQQEDKKNLIAFDFTFRFPFSEDQTAKFEKQSLSFDEFRYQMADVPFDEKWNLKLNRNAAQEKKVLDYVIERAGNDFSLCHLDGTYNHSTFTDNSEYTDCSPFPITPLTDSVLDWIGALERARSIWCVDSCIANLVNQLNLPNKKYFQVKAEVKTMPVLRGDWALL